MRERSSESCSSAPGLPCTQCGGHGPPCSRNDAWSAGCQSRVATTRSKSPESTSSFTRGAIASPSGTARAPPLVKSFWKSMISRARATAPDNRRVRDLLLTPEEATAMDAPGTKDAAVLVALHGDPLTAVFTERRAALRRHAGEISFPGGRQDEPGEDLRETALREAEEEIGLPRSAVTLQGALPPVGTFVTGYRVFPFVGLVERPAQLHPAEAEVARILEFSLPELIAGHEMKRLIRKGGPIKMPTYTVDGHLIWGATARMVEMLLERLAPII